jgi:hypothetical protein
MRLTICCIFFFLLCSCASSGPEQQATQTRTITEIADTLSFNYETVKEISNYLVGDEEHLDTTYFQITYPVFSDEKIKKLTHSSIFIEGESNAHDAAQVFLDGYNEFIEEETVHHVSTAWVKDIKSFISANTPRLLSLCTSFYEYTGGAHGHNVAIWSNFDLHEMRKIELTDVVEAEKIETLRQIAERHFRNVENLSDTTSLATIFVLNDNFGFTENNLMFYYNEYEIKPYVKGSTTVEIPYTEIVEILSVRGQEYINSFKKTD